MQPRCQIEGSHSSIISRTPSSKDGEHQAIAPSDPDFKKIYARRNDSESINRGLDDTLWLTRAHSVGHLQQTVNLPGYALMVNGLTLLEHRRRAEGLARAA